MATKELTREDILAKVAGLALSWLKLQQEPGQYEIEFDPESQQVYITSTYSGDNSYIPGDPAIMLLRADCREYSGPEVVGLTDDGEEIADTETMAEILRLAGEALDQAIIDDDWIDPEQGDTY